MCRKWLAVVADNGRSRVTMLQLTTPVCSHYTFHDVTVTSRLQRIFNQQPYVAETLWIGILSATTATNFV